MNGSCSDALRLAALVWAATVAACSGTVEIDEQFEEAPLFKQFDVLIGIHFTGPARSAAAHHFFLFMAIAGCN